MTDNSSRPVCCIFGAGEYYNTDYTALVPDRALVIAADGGLARLSGLGIKPDIIVGDFDSLDNSVSFSAFPTAELIRLNPVKDDTDTLHAVNLALDRGYTEFRLFGCTGGRTSHTIANIQLLHMLSKRSAVGYLFGNGEVMTAFSDSALNFSSDARGYISVFSLTDQSDGVCETGLRYSLDNYTLKSTDTIGVSNEFTGNPASVSVKNGTLLAVFGDIGFIE